MIPYQKMTKEELLKEQAVLQSAYKEFQGRGLKLDMSRGKPAPNQLDLSMGMLDVLTSQDVLACEDGLDARKLRLAGWDSGSEGIICRNSGGQPG